jgi:Leucine-rich repeat (LRR) protein
MNTFGLVSLVVCIGLAVWFLGGQFEKLKDENSGDGVYKEALDSARDVSNQVSKKTEEAVSSGSSVTVYDGISVSSNTKILDLSSRGLAGSLKAEVRQLTELRELNMSNNKLTGIPAEVGQLSKLEVLNLSNNPFTGLPQEIGNLKNLKVLDLRGTQYAKQDLEIIQKNLPSSTQVLTD